GFFPAQHEYIDRRDERGEYAEVRDAYAVPDPRGGIVTECLAFWTAAQLHGHAAADSLSAEREARRKLASLEQRDSTGCAATSLAGRDGNYDSDPPEAMAHLRRAAGLAAHRVGARTDKGMDPRRHDPSLYRRRRLARPMVGAQRSGQMASRPRESSRRHPTARLGGMARRVERPTLVPAHRANAARPRGGEARPHAGVGAGL